MCSSGSSSSSDEAAAAGSARKVTRHPAERGVQMRVLLLLLLDHASAWGTHMKLIFWQVASVQHSGLLLMNSSL